MHMNMILHAQLILIAVCSCGFSLVIGLQLLVES